MPDYNRYAGPAPYIGAPYNFVPFAEKVNPYPDAEAPAHNDVEIHKEDGTTEELFSGEIAYSITAETPVFIGSGKKTRQQTGTGIEAEVEGFYRNADGRFAIPGSSILGMVRANVQALSLSSFEDDVDDYALMFRNVAGKAGTEKDRYARILGADQVSISAGSGMQNVSVLKNVRAGYVKKEDGKYKIYDTQLDQVDEKLGVMNYYILSERAIVKAFADSKRDNIPFPYPIFLKKDGTTILQHRIDRPFVKYIVVKQLYDSNIDLNGKVVPCSYEMEKPGRSYKVGAPGCYKEEGRIITVSAGTKKKSYFEYDDKNLTNRFQITGIQYRGTENKPYNPYVIPCSYVVSGLKVLKVGAPDDYPLKGCAVSTGKMQQKKAVYIIPAMDEKKMVRFRGDREKLPIEISERDLRAFRIDIERRETVLKTFGGRDIFDLPKNGETKPIFYIRLGNRLYFGFTPRLRLFYDHTIKDGLPDSHRNAGLDYARALFGYSNDRSAYKSRLSFGEAAAENGSQADKPVSVILAEPKPTSYLDYIVPEGNGGVSYNAPKFRLRGMKQYWLRDEAAGKVPKDKEGKDYVSWFTPLKKGTRFSGKIRFHNLKKEELGLLLFALGRCPENSLGDGSKPDFRMNIGKGKAFGFGVIRMDIRQLRTFDLEKVCDLSSLRLSPWKDWNLKAQETFVTSWVETLKGVVEDDNPLTHPSVRTLLVMKNGAQKPDPGRIRQMTIGDSTTGQRNEYQGRTTPLDPAGQVAGISIRQEINADPPKGELSEAERKELEERKKAQEAVEKAAKAAEEAARQAAIRRQAAEKAKAGLQVGNVLPAKVTKVEGKYVSFRTDTGLNGRFTPDAVVFMTVSKKDIKTVFPKDCPIEVRVKELLEDNKASWECTGKK